MTFPRRTAVIAGILAACLLVLAADVVIVKVQSTAIRKTPQFFAPVLANLKAGDRLEKLGASGGWIQVRTPAGISGWIHAGAVEAPKFNLMASDTALKTRASTSEVALAGKGFNRQVEDSYRARHAELNFGLVDRLLQIKLAAATLEDFLRKGRLGDFRGGVR